MPRNQADRDLERNQDVSKLEKERDKLEEKCEKQEKRVQQFQAMIIQLSNFYIVFQGVILTVVSQAQTLTCEDWWIPFLLSLTGTIVSFAALGHAIIKYLKTRRHYEGYRNDIQEKTRRIEEDAHLTGKPSAPEPSGKIDEYRFFWRAFFLVLMAVFILGFGVVIMIACRTVLCRSKCNADNSCNKSGSESP